MTSLPLSDEATFAQAKISGRRVITLADVAPERIQWFWPGYLPVGKITMLDGDPGLGKTTLALDIAARITTGALMPGENGSSGLRPRSVLLVTAEDGIADTIRPRIDAAGGDPGRVFTYDEWEPVIPNDINQIEATVREHDVALVILDPFVALLGGQTSAHKDQDIRRAMRPIASLCERTGAAALPIRHLNKSEGRSAIYRGGGSIGIAGAARSVMMVAEDPNDPDARILASVKANLGGRPMGWRFRVVAPSDVARIDWIERVEIRADQLVAPPVQPRGSRRMKAADALQQALADGPRRRSEVLAEVMAITGCSERTIERAMSEAGVVSECPVATEPAVWSIPDYPSDGTVGTRRLRAYVADISTPTPKNRDGMEKTAPKAVLAGHPVPSNYVPSTQVPRRDVSVHVDEESAETVILGELRRHGPMRQLDLQELARKHGVDGLAVSTTLESLRKTRQLRRNDGVWSIPPSQPQVVGNNS